MADYLQTQISIRRARLAALEKERLTVEAELRAYEDAFSRTSTSHSQMKLSTTWTEILRALGTYKRFNSQDVQIAARRLGTPQNPVNVRSQLSIYTRKEIIKRLGGGNYQLTEKTKIALANKTQPSPSPLPI